MSGARTVYRIWARRVWVWVPALLFFLVNVALFSTYRVVYSGQIQNLRDRLEQREERLEEVQARAAEMEALVRSARETRQGLGELYSDRLASERIRFTKVASEIRELARRSGLEPAAMTYPTEEIGDFGLVKRLFTFSVTGTYVELRRFVNLLELTPTFITLEQVELSGEEGERLRIRLSLSTLFAEEGAAEAIGPSGTDRATGEGRS